MTVSPTVQMNMRVNGATKQQAEEVLALLGYTLPDFVRALLGKVAHGAKDAEEVRRVLIDTPTPVASEPTKAQLWFDRIYRHHAEMAEALGVDLSTFPVFTEEEQEELLYEYYEERDRERLMYGD